MKKDKKVVIFSSDSCIHDFPDKPHEFIKWCKDKFDLCPPKYIDKLRIDCVTTIDYDSPNLEVDIFYYRQETDEEYTERLEKEKKAIKLKEELELCELERLRKKYGV